MKSIPVKTGDGVVHALVDDVDWDRFRDLPWWLMNRYAGMKIRRNGAASSVSMHRLILGLDRGNPLQGDHINHNTLDNRRENLRVVTVAGNARNRSSVTGSSSRFRGVSWARSRDLWLAAAKYEGRSHNLGYYVDELEAAEVVNGFWVDRGCLAPNSLAIREEAERLGVTP